MSNSRIVGFCANTQKPSKTLTLLQNVAHELETRFGLQVQIFDLSEIKMEMLSFGAVSGGAARLVEAIETADGLIVGSAVYKGSYTGLFKHVFDLVRPDALADRPVLLSAVGGGARHCLMVEHQLRPLFGFFEAFTVPTAVYASESDFREDRVANLAVQKRIATASSQFARLLFERQIQAAE